MASFLTPIRGGSARFQGSARAVPSGGGGAPSPESQALLGMADTLGQFNQSQVQLFGRIQAERERQEEKLRILQEKKREALVASTVAKRIASANESLSALRFDLPNMPGVHPLARREVFTQQANQMLMQVGQGLDETDANEAYAHLQEKATALANSLDQEGTQAFVKQETDSLESELHVYSREFVSAETPREQELTLANVALSLSKRVETGIITTAQQAKMTQDFIDNANSIAVETAINVDPEGFFDHLDDLMSGGAGVAGMPIPSDLNKAFEMAQKEIREINAFADRAEARAEKFEGEAQAAAAFELYANALEARKDPGKLTQLFNQTRELRKADAISASEGAKVASSITGMLDELASGGVSDDVDVIRQFRRIADTDPDAAIAYVREHEGTNLKFGTVNTLLGQATNMKQEGHISRMPEYKAAEDAIQGAFSPSSMLADMVDSVTLNRIKSEAVDEFRQRMFTLAGPSGTVTGPAIDALPDVRDRVIQSFRAQFSQYQPGSELPAAPPIARSVPDLMTTAMRAINNGANKSQVEGWVRRDLIRLYQSQGGSVDDMAAFDAWAALMLQKIREGRAGGTPK